MQPQDLGGIGRMGGSMRLPGKTELTVIHILCRLQGELQKSRESGAKLHNLTGAMTNIRDTVDGSLVRIHRLQSNAPSHVLLAFKPSSLSSSTSSSFDLFSPNHHPQSQPPLRPHSMGFRPSCTRPNLPSPATSIKSERLRVFSPSMRPSNMRFHW